MKEMKEKYTKKVYKDLIKFRWLQYEEIDIINITRIFWTHDLTFEI